MSKELSYPEIDMLLEKSENAFHIYKKSSLADRAAFMRLIASEIELLGDVLIETAAAETNLPFARLQGERARTVFQLKSYADAVENASWMGLSIDTANLERVPPKPDTRKTSVPLGPVLVFGASNFPFAYSTAGGDTACAFAAGCPVIVKAHPAHPKTSTLVADAIFKAIEKAKMPEGVFTHLVSEGFDLGAYLTKHPKVKAVGFTGSFSGGKALFDLANQRPDPIPVFAEMGSVNPVFLFPEKLKIEFESLAKQLAASVTLGMGQFCTNPGIMVAIDSQPLAKFVHQLKKEIEILKPSAMLHQGIVSHFETNLDQAICQKGVQIIAESTTKAGDGQGQITIATVTGETFLQNPILHKEVFGPYSLLVQCADQAQLMAVARALEGQLTVTLMGTAQDIENQGELKNVLQDKCGRLIFNNVPTGVEVALSMQHGGPFPASTDSRFSAVGADGIKRFARPLCYQNCEDSFLPEELKNANPLNVYRMVDNVMTKDPIA